MSLARVHNPLGNTIIRQLGDAGGPRSDWVADEINNLIAWVRSSPRNIRRDFSVVNSAGVGPDVLHTFTLPANSLETDGDYLTVWYGGNFAANVRNKAVQAQFDGQDYQGAGVTDIQGAIGWVVAARIARLSSTSVRVSSFLLENAMGITTAGVAGSFGTGSNMFCRSNDLAGVANLNSNAVVMRVRSVVSAGAAAADVVQNMSIIELTQQ